MARLVIYGCGGFGRELVRSAGHLVATDGSLESLLFASDKPSGPIMGIESIHLGLRRTAIFG